MLVCLTGVTGNMGQSVLKELVEYDKIDRIRLFILTDDPIYNRVKGLIHKHKNKITIVHGNLGNKEDVRRFLYGADYVVNLAAVIPPKSDKNPKKAIECNEITDHVGAWLERL